MLCHIDEASGPTETTSRVTWGIGTHGPNMAWLGRRPKKGVRATIEGNGPRKMTGPARGQKGTKMAVIIQKGGPAWLAEGPSRSKAKREAQSAACPQRESETNTGKVALDGARSAGGQQPPTWAFSSEDGGSPKKGKWSSEGTRPGQRPKGRPPWICSSHALGCLSAVSSVGRRAQRSQRARGGRGSPHGSASARRRAARHGRSWDRGHGRRMAQSERSRSFAGAQSPGDRTRLRSADAALEGEEARVRGRAAGWLLVGAACGRLILAAGFQACRGIEVRDRVMIIAALSTMPPLGRRPAGARSAARFAARSAADRLGRRSAALRSGAPPTRQPERGRGSALRCPPTPLRTFRPHRSHGHHRPISRV